MFWIGCERSWTRPAAIRPNIAWRSWRLDVFLKLDEPVRHRVERVAELAEFVARADVDARVELAGGDALRAALQLAGSALMNERPKTKPTAIMPSSAIEIAAMS